MLCLGWEFSVGNFPSVGKHHITKTTCKDVVVLLKPPLKRELGELGLRAANTPVVKH